MADLRRVAPLLTSSGASPRRGHQGVGAPVFILGAPRSGTSLIYKALCLHPEAAYISNWVRRFPGVPALAAFNRIGRRFPNVVESAWFERDGNAYVYGSRRPLLRRLFPMPVEGEPVFARCGIADQPNAPLPPGDGGAALRDLMSDVCLFSGGRHLISKRIANNRRIPLLLEAFPDARFVNTVRDGRAVAVSLTKVNWWNESVVWWCQKTPVQWQEGGGDPWELCAREWVEHLRAIEAGLQLVPAEQVFHMTYEELVSDPVSTLRRVARFAALPESVSWEQRLSRLKFPNKNRAWMEELSPETIEKIQSIQREQLIRCGYLS